MAKKGLAKTIVFAVIIAAIFLPPFAKYQEMRYRNKDLERQIIALKQETKRLEEEKSRLETDMSYVESKARERIGVVKKGEIILKE